MSSRQGEERWDSESGADGSEEGRRGSGEELVQALFEVVIFASSFGQGLELQQCNIKKHKERVSQKTCPKLRNPKKLTSDRPETSAAKALLSTPSSQSLRPNSRVFRNIFSWNQLYEL